MICCGVMGFKNGYGTGFSIGSAVTGTVNNIQGWLAYFFVGEGRAKDWRLTPSFHAARSDRKYPFGNIARIPPAPPGIGNHLT